MEVNLSEFNLSSFNFSSWMAEWQTTEVSLSEFNFDSWIAEWQTILGLVFILGWPCLFCVVFVIASVPAQWVGECSKGRAYDRDKDLDRLGKDKALRHLCMYSGLYLLIYGTLKHSPGLAVLVAALHTLITASLQLCWLAGTANENNSKASNEREKGEEIKLAPLTHGDDQTDQATANENKHQASNQDQKEEALVPESVYSNFEGRPILECASVFAIQIMLYGMVLSEVFFQNPIFEEIEERQMWFYIGGAAIGSVVRLTGDSFENHEWKPFWERYFFENFRDKEMHWTWLRFAMSWVVNHLLADIILLMLPVILMQADDNMDFVKDATSVLFISELDNISNAIDIKRQSNQPSGPPPKKTGQPQKDTE
ncbi:unnamed protein product [Durusdinium trenchii]|uniref:Uncharacterized protein n=2 Tax=Durusdinium trenchii TaxID=1381693 RepID=A0ABP0S419_9DINO